MKSISPGVSLGAVGFAWW